MTEYENGIPFMVLTVIGAIIAAIIWAVVLFG